MSDVFQQQKLHDLLFINTWMSKWNGLVAGFTTRLGGFSEEPFLSNNMGLHVDDNEQHVIRNRQQLCQHLSFPFESFTCAQQVHSNKVQVVTYKERGRGRLSAQDAIQDTDGIITNESNILLTSFYADCVPLLFVDPIKKVVALAHAGWKGTVEAIAKQTIDLMQAQYQCEAQSIYAAIGPSIGQCCYEVDKRVIDAVHVLWDKEQLPKHLLETCIRPINELKALINLKEINRQIMIKAGILSSNIEISKLCTGCSTDLFFSHRIEGGKTGRMASFIGWQERT